MEVSDERVNSVFNPCRRTYDNWFSSLCAIFQKGGVGINAGAGAYHKISAEEAKQK